MVIASPRSRQQCADLLQPHLSMLNDCFDAAWQRWLTWLGRLDGSPADVSPRSRANVLYDFIRSEAIRRFAEVPGVDARERRKLLTLQFDDSLILRFKKFRSNTLKISHNRTIQGVAFNQQELEFVTPLEPMTHLVAGYLLDDLALNLERLAITCSIGGEHLWAPIDIIERALPLVESTLPSGEPKKPVVRSKRKLKKPNSTDEG